MAGRITAATETQLIVDIREDLRRRRVNLGQQTLTWAYDRFVAPATYQLTYLPYGINVLADNGSVLAEATDYTVDYTTGVVTFGTGRTSGHVIYVSYVTTGDLVAASGPADTGMIVDTFNRADSATTLNPASDGGIWSTYTADATTPVFGIQSNAAFQVSGADPFRFAYRDLQSASCDISYTTTFSFARQFLVFAFDPVAFVGYQLYSWGGPPHVYKLASGGRTVLGAFASSPAISTGSTVRVTYDPTTGDITYYLNGASKGTVTDTTPVTSGTNVAFGSEQTYYVGGGSSGSTNTGETWDNFTATPL